MKQIPSTSTSSSTQTLKWLSSTHTSTTQPRKATGNSITERSVGEPDLFTKRMRPTTVSEMSQKKDIGQRAKVVHGRQPATEELDATKQAHRQPRPRPQYPQHHRTRRERWFQRPCQGNRRKPPDPETRRRVQEARTHPAGVPLAMEPFCTVSQAYGHFEPFLAIFDQSPSLAKTNPGVLF